MNSWKLASTWGIQLSGNSIDDPKAVWNAGHVNDILILDTGGTSTEPSLLVASDTGGVWIVTTIEVAIPLSDNWDFPNMSCLEKGPDGDSHFFAGGDALYVTDAQGVFSILQWRPILFPTNGSVILDASGNAVGSINKMAVLVDKSKGIRKIILACTHGVFWSTIPTPGGVYTFYKANVPVTGSDSFSTIALGPNNTVVIGAYGANVTENHYGIFFGNFNTHIIGHTQIETLDFTRSLINGANDKIMSRIAMDSCLEDRNAMYATAGTINNDRAYTVIKSTDGGKTWNQCGALINGDSRLLFPDTDINNPTTLGNQTWYNICISVSPFNKNMVAIGFRNPPYYSLDGGLSWNPVKANVHSDLHVLYFDPLDKKKKRLYIGSDGGVFMTPDLGKTIDFNYNRQFPNLQIQQYQNQSTFSTSYDFDNLVATSVQDNGNLFTIFDGVTPWFQIDGGDGICSMFLRNNKFLRIDENFSQVRISKWDINTNNFGDIATALSNGIIPVGNTGAGLHNPTFIEIISSPQYQVNGELMYAVAGKANTVYGLFSEPNADTWHWNPLKIIPTENITSVGSADGNIVLIGTSTGKIYELNTSNSSLNDISPASNNSQINRFLIISKDNIFATANRKGILWYNGISWILIVGIPSSSFYAIESDPTNHQALYVATEDMVYQSTNNGNNWTPFSNGLPKMPHCADLRFIQGNNGLNILYVATYGRSVYKIQLNLGVVGPINIPGVDPGDLKNGEEKNLMI